MVTKPAHEPVKAQSGTLPVKPARPVPRPAAGKARASAPAKSPAIASGKKPASLKPAGPAAAESGAKPGKTKTKPVRDSFTMPQADFGLIAGLKDRALGLKRHAKKSELLRAGLHALSALDDAALLAVLGDLTPLKPGRPKKSA